MRKKHFDPHVMLISSMQWNPIILYGMTTGQNILNIGRAINAGVGTFHTDGTYNVCWSNICLIGVRTAIRCDGTATVGFSVNPSESEEDI